VVILLACAEAPPDAGLPPGTLLSGETAAARRALACLDAFAPSPASAWAAGFDLPCREFGSSDGTPRCSDEGRPLATIRGDADVAFAVPVGGGRAVGTVRVAGDGAFAVHAELAKGSLAGAAALLVAGEAPLPTLLPGDGAVVQARVATADGLDPALVASGSGQRKLGLEGQLFSGVVLDGRWEFAAWTPVEWRGAPEAALAVGVRSPAAAEAAVAEWLAGVRARWGTRVVAWPERRGGCMPDLALLPGFTPCYAVTDAALVVGWDRGSTARALSPPTGEGQFVLDLDEMATLERKMGATPPPYPWGRVTASVVERGARVVVDVRSDRGCEPIE
jgi:hypothetical protein